MRWFADKYNSYEFDPSEFEQEQREYFEDIEIFKELSKNEQLELIGVCLSKRYIDDSYKPMIQSIYEKYQRGNISEKQLMVLARTYAYTF